MKGHWNEVGNESCCESEKFVNEEKKEERDGSEGIGQEE